MSIISWIKRNKLASFLILVIVFLFGRSFINSFFGISVSNLSRQATFPSYTSDMAMGESAGLSMPTNAKTSGLSLPRVPAPAEAPPTTDVSNRMVVQESYLSLVVNNVRQTVNQIITYASQSGGYMVSSTLNQPEDAPFATVVVRVPSETLDQTLEYYRSLSIKVSSENLYGHDVTDQYQDLETRISRLRKTQAKFEQLLDQATNFDQILQAQREVLNLQDQIDNLIGRQQYLEQTAKLAKLTIYLSTDELALPYTPSETFRPAVVFKLAVRSLLQTLQNLAAKAIWLAVYAVIWVPALLLFIFGRRWWQRKHPNKPTSI